MNDNCSIKYRLFVLIVFSLLTGNAAWAANRATPFQLQEATIADIQRGLSTGQITCRALVSAYLARIEAYDQPLEVNAITAINPAALARADALDRALAAGNELRPLHCVPLIVKDNYDTADLPTTAGSLALKDSLPPDDAYIVRVLRAAGAIVLAKSNMAEWAFSPYFTISSTAGVTRNVYALDRVPAGSSGGTASGIAANFAAVGLGTDTGNSIRGPAAHTALVGLRPTLGLVSRDGIVPLLLNRDTGGALTRTVEDTARIMAVIAGPDPADPLTAGSAEIKLDFMAALDEQALRGVHIGVLRALVDTPTADAQVKKLFEAALEDLRRQGAKIVDPFVVPDFTALTEATGFCSRFRYDLKNYLATLGENAPVRTLQEIAAAGVTDPSADRGLQWGLSTTVSPEEMEPPCVSVEDDPRRRALRDAMVSAMNAAGVRAVVYPTWNNPPRLLGDLDSPHGNNSPVIAPHAGLPAVSVPMGFTHGRFPAGLQFLGRPFSDAELLGLAYDYEQATRHRRPPPLFPALAGAGSASQSDTGF